MRSMIATACITASELMVGCTGAPDEPELRTRQQDLAMASVDQTGSSEGRQRRQREVDEYHRVRTEGWDIVDTRQSPSGQIIDYVRPETMFPDAPDAPFATPPELDDELPPEEFEGPDGIVVRRGATEVEVQPELHPPPGTIPVLHDQFLEYVENGDAYRNLQDFLAHLPTPANATVGTFPKLYGKHDARFSIEELNAAINLWNYGDATTSSDFTLMQIALSEPVGTPPVTQDSIEVGYLKSRDIYVTVPESTRLGGLPTA